MYFFVIQGPSNCFPSSCYWRLMFCFCSYKDGGLWNQKYANGHFLLKWNCRKGGDGNKTSLIESHCWYTFDGAQWCLNISWAVVEYDLWKPPFLGAVVSGVAPLAGMSGLSTCRSRWQMQGSDAFIWRGSCSQYFCIIRFSIFIF